MICLRFPTSFTDRFSLRVDISSTGILDQVTRAFSCYQLGLSRLGSDKAGLCKLNLTFLQLFSEDCSISKTLTVSAL